MKLSIVSDVHLERDTRVVLDNREKSDTIILAGDIGAGFSVDTLRFIKRCCDYYENVIYILGNHEIYGHTVFPNGKFDYVYKVSDLIEFWSGIADNIPNLTFLNDSHCIIGGKKFIGSVLYSDVKSNINEFELEYVNNVNGIGFDTIADFNEEDVESRMMNIELYDKKFNKSLNYIKSEISKTHYDSKILITHYAPLMNSVCNSFVDFPGKRFYASDLSSVLSGQELDFIIHGHLHNRSDYYFENTRVICNPYGHEHNPHFKIKQITI